MLHFTDADVDRFMGYVEKLPNGCWFWAGARSRGKGNKKWYGSFRLGKRVVRAHRFSCDALRKEECPPGYHRDHTCCFSLCVNPEHIEVVPSEVNQQRKMDRKRVLICPELRTPNTRSRFIISPILQRLFACARILIAETKFGYLFTIETEMSKWPSKD